MVGCVGGALKNEGVLALPRPLPAASASSPASSSDAPPSLSSSPPLSPLASTRRAQNPLPIAPALPPHAPSGPFRFSPLLAPPLHRLFPTSLRQLKTASFNVLYNFPLHSVATCKMKTCKFTIVGRIGNHEF